MIRKRLGRSATVFTVASLALMMVGAGTVSAATPTLTTAWTVIPTTVHDGDYVAFRGSIRNDDSSTVSQLFLVEPARDANLTLIAGTLSASQGTCVSTDTTFTCTLGQLKPRKTATVTAIYRAALLTAPATSYSAKGGWEFNTTGLGSGGGDSSHGDSWPSLNPDTGIDALTASVTSSGDFGGRYVLNSDLKIVENSQALSNANPHSTRAFAPVTGIGVTVEDIDCSITSPDPICADLSTGFGQVSKVNVNNDVDDSGITGTTLLHFYLQLDSSEIPQGKNANSVNVLHVYPGGSETITARCVFARKATEPSNAPCITVKSLPGGDLGIDVWSFHNGGIRAF